MANAKARKLTVKHIKEAFDYICEKYKVDEEDIRDCTVKHRKARSAFIKLCHHKYLMSLATIGEQVGSRTKECLIEYLEMEDE